MAPTFAATAADTEGIYELKLEGALTLEGGGDLWRTLRDVVMPQRSVVVDLTGVDRMDGAGAAMLTALHGRLLMAGGQCTFKGGSPEVRHMLELYECPEGVSCLKSAPMPESAVEQVGRVTVDYLSALRGVAAFAGSFAVAAARAVRRPRTVHWASVGRLMEKAGADGVPIVVLINFLIGFIMALQAAEQLALFGANIFVADLIGLSVTRELGPLMTAIIVTGRTGAAYAAEIGTMVVNEEVDALHTMRLDPMRFLVFPRLIALCVMVPLLVLLADFVGCVGGLIVAQTSLDLTTVAYVNRLQSAIGLWDVFGGMLKGIVFAGAITLIACQRGFAVRGGAAGVGGGTTSAVVTSLFTLVILDAFFTWFFRLLGI